MARGSRSALTDGEPGAETGISLTSSHFVFTQIL